MDELHLDSILDAIVEDVQKEFPDKSEFEAGFMALRMKLTITIQFLAEIGMTGDGLSNEMLFRLCSSLVETCQWMAAKEMAADTVRDIDGL